MISASHKTRLMTAAVGLPLIIIAIVMGGAPMFALVLAGTLAGLWEFFGLFPGMSVCVRGLGLLLGALMLYLSWQYGPAGGMTALFAALWIEELAILFGHGRPAPARSGPCPPRWMLLAGLLFVPGSLQFLLVFGPGETALVLAAVMATDTGAYYSGLYFGGPKIWPSVSPKKTWAGSAGGLCAALAVCLTVGLIWGKAPLGAWLLLGLSLSVASQMGDFVESALKRTAGIKDSGTILPGHGGLLDRIDGILPAVLIYALARQLTVFL